MKFEKKEIEVPWKDNAVLIFDFPSIPTMIEKYPELFGADEKKNAEAARSNASRGGVRRIRDGLIRWKEIIDHEDKPIPFNVENRDWVIGKAFEDPELMVRVGVAMGGPSPNSEAG